jgi:hypothetical protein
MVPARPTALSHLRMEAKYAGTFRRESALRAIPAALVWINGNDGRGLQPPPSADAFGALFLESIGREASGSRARARRAEQAL